MNVLIVEDEVAVAESIKKTLSNCDLINIIDIADDFDSAVRKIDSGVFEFVLLDIFLGKNSLNGLDLCEYIKEKNPKIPIIIMTGFDSLQHLEQAFKLGVCDYIRKPFNARELELRVERWIQLSKKVTSRKQIEYHGLSYDFCENQFSYTDNVINLTKKNKILLFLFMQNPEQLLTTDYIKEKFWGDYYPEKHGRNLRSNIQSLRKSLKATCPEWIRTARGEGYILRKNYEKDTNTGG